MLLRTHVTREWAAGVRQQLLPHWRVDAGPAAAHLGGAVFLGRRGGVSTGPFASLNLSVRVGDEPAAVAENWRMVGAAFPAVQRWVLMRQVHGNLVLALGAAEVDSVPECDGVVTDLRDVALCVLTADCVPVLIAGRGGTPVAAVHAGWRGTVADIAGRAIGLLREHCGLSPRDLWVVLGPAIGPCCYNVGVDVANALERAGLGAAAQVSPPGISYRADLRLANRIALVRAGVPEENIVGIERCTSCQYRDFFSHRRQGIPSGRQLSFIVCGKMQLGQ